MRQPLTSSPRRVFLLLQGPHGPFFNRLAKALEATGADTWRVGFNRGDQFFWSRKDRFIPCQVNPDDWPARLDEIIDDHGITDIVCYGGSRPIHRVALDAAKLRGLTTHVFEEGYLRPHWVTYERGGTNGQSRLMTLTMDDMAEAVSGSTSQAVEAPDHWGDMRQHIFWGAVYHASILVGRRRFPAFRPHRELDVVGELRVYLRHLLFMPWRRLHRMIATTQVRHGGFPYHLVLLQLSHDASLRDHSPFGDQKTFIDFALQAFAEGAPPHHHLVFKAHPLDDGRVAHRRLVKQGAARYGLEKRVHFLTGGKLARLLRYTRSAVTINSTAAQQVLWRGIPLKAFGASVYTKAGFVSQQPLAQFFRKPEWPDASAYMIYRRFLLATSQIAGGFYSRRGRRELLRRLPDLMLDAQDPYDQLLNFDAADPQHIRLVT